MRTGLAWRVERTRARGSDAGRRKRPLQGRVALLVKQGLRWGEARGRGQKEMGDSKGGMFHGACAGFRGKSTGLSSFASPPASALKQTAARNRAQELRAGAEQHRWEWGLYRASANRVRFTWVATAFAHTHCGSLKTPESTGLQKLVSSRLRTVAPATSDTVCERGRGCVQREVHTWIGSRHLL